MSSSKPHPPRGWSAQNPPAISVVGSAESQSGIEAHFEERLVELDQMAGSASTESFRKELLAAAAELTTARVCRLWKKSNKTPWQLIARHDSNSSDSNSASRTSVSSDSDSSALLNHAVKWESVLATPDGPIPPQWQLETRTDQASVSSFGSVVWRIEDGTSGVLEFSGFVHDPRERRLVPEIAVALAEIGAEDERRRRLRAIPDEHRRWEQLWGYVKQLQQCSSRISLDQMIVEELRRLVGCDRVILASVKSRDAKATKPRNWRVNGVSGATTVSHQSDVPRRIKKFAADNAQVPTTIICDSIPHDIGSTIKADKTDSDDPRLNSWWHEYADTTAVKGCLAVSWRTIANKKSPSDSKETNPVRVELPSQFDTVDSPEQDLDADAADQIFQNHGLLMFEWFTHSSPATNTSEAISGRNSAILLPLLLRSTVDALEQRNRVDQLPGIGFARRLAVFRRTWWSVGMTRGRAAILAIAAMVLAMVFVPADFHVTARGTIWPTDYRELFAPEDGIVAEVNLNDDSKVNAAQALIRLQNPTLDQQKTEFEGEIATMQQKLIAIQAEQLDVTRKEDAAHDAELTAQEAEVQKMIQVRTEQLKIITQRLGTLTIDAPFDGQALTWNAKSRLQGRPVKQGDGLLTIAQPHGMWRAELRLTESIASYVPNRVVLNNEPLEIELRLATSPGTKLKAKLKNRSLRSETDPVWGTGIRADAMLDMTVDELNREIAAGHLTPGTEVSAKIPCGERPLGFVLFHDLWDAWRRWW